jgi:hypothetical protein
MTAEEEAKELFEKYQNLLIANYDLDGEDYLTKAHAKQCALIAVDVILYNIPKTRSKPQLNQANIDYWNDVKNHLKAL